MSDDIEARVIYLPQSTWEYLAEAGRVVSDLPIGFSDSSDEEIGIMVATGMMMEYDDGDLVEREADA